MKVALIKVKCAALALRGCMSRKRFYEVSRPHYFGVLLPWQRWRILYTDLLAIASKADLVGVRRYSAQEVARMSVVALEDKYPTPHRYWLVVAPQVMDASKNSQPGRVVDGFFVPLRAQCVNKLMRTRPVI